MIYLRDIVFPTVASGCCPFVAEVVRGITSVQFVGSEWGAYCHFPYTVAPPAESCPISTNVAVNVFWCPAILQRYSGSLVSKSKTTFGNVVTCDVMESGLNIIGAAGGLRSHIAVA